VGVGPNHWTKTKINFRALGSKSAMALLMTRRGEKFYVLEIILLVLGPSREKIGLFSYLTIHFSQQ